MNRVDSQYQDIIHNVLEFGEERNDRTGTGTLSYFGGSFSHCMCDGFPVLTTKKMPLKTIATELRWFLKGGTNIRELLFDNCGIWTGDAYKRYLNTMDGQVIGLSKDEFIKNIKEDYSFSLIHGDLGPIYGKQWKDWKGIDQIKNLIESLKENPHGRRHLVNAWNVEDLHLMTLPPCHYGFQCYVSNDNKLSLLWNQRSVDVFLGLPFNISSYGMLLMILCKETGYEPGQLIGNFGDVHIYKNHLPQVKEIVKRIGYELPKLEIIGSDILQGEFEFKITNYQSHESLKAKLSN